MKYPDFFDEVETIKIYDDLSDFLGSFENGLIEFTYLDAVKNAGHSCPTIAGAYLMVKEAIKALDNPKRGEIFIEFKEDITEGVTGVIANIFSQITGSTEKSGFKGIGGKFVRHSLMEFNKDIENIKFTNLKTNKSIYISYSHKNIPQDPNMPILMQKIMSNQATEEEKETFRNLWQNRVKEILFNPQKVLEVKYE